MIDKNDIQFSISEQCSLLGMARSTLYYTPSVSTPENLAIMSEMDKLYLEFIHFYNKNREHSELGYNPPAVRYLAVA